MSRAVTFIGTGLVLVCATLGNASCSDVAISGQPTSGIPPTGSASTSRPPAPRTVDNIKTCEDLTASDITAAGLDPATKRDSSIETKVFERGCRWTGRDVLVDIYVTNATVAMYKTRADLADVQFPVVAGLPSISFHIPDDPEACSLISDIPGGGLVVQLGIKGEHEAAFGVDSCTGAKRVMEQVAPILLKAK